LVPALGFTILRVRLTSVRKTGSSTVSPSCGSPETSGSRCRSGSGDETDHSHSRRWNVPLPADFTVCTKPPSPWRTRGVKPAFQRVRPAVSKYLVHWCSATDSPSLAGHARGSILARASGDTRNFNSVSME
jgi:hypothetical protein